MNRPNRKIDKHGYVWIYKPEHHLALKHGYVAEHRLVAETKLGRKLLPGESVHHINGIKYDNGPHNIAVLMNSQHSKMHRMGDTHHSIEIKPCKNQKRSWLDCLIENCWPNHENYYDHITKHN